MAIVAQNADNIFNILASLPLYKHDIAIRITKGT